MLHHPLALAYSIYMGTFTSSGQFQLSINLFPSAAPLTAYPSRHNDPNSGQNVNTLNDRHQSNRRSMCRKLLWWASFFSFFFFSRPLNKTLAANEEFSCGDEKMESAWRVTRSESLREARWTWRVRNLSARGTWMSTSGPERSPAPSHPPSPCRWSSKWR